METAVTQQSRADAYAHRVGIQQLIDTPQKAERVANYTRKGIVWNINTRDFSDKIKSLRQVAIDRMVPAFNWHCKCCGVPVPETFTAEQGIRALVHWELALEVQESGGNRYAWLPQYDAIVDWLCNNDGKGLLLYGTCGQGKTLMMKIISRLLPLLYGIFVQQIIDAVDLDSRISDLRQSRIVFVDDIGTEFISAFRNMSFGMLVDSLEKKKGILIASTNLDFASMYERYGERVCDRLKGLCRMIEFDGENSFRDAQLQSVKFSTTNNNNNQ